jgi:hypothetical protein
MVASFSKRVALLGRKINATHDALLDADHVFGKGKRNL